MSQMLIRINEKMDDALKELAKAHYVEDTPEGIILNGVIEQWESAENHQIIIRKDDDPILYARERLDEYDRELLDAYERDEREAAEQYKKEYRLD